MQALSVPGCLLGLDWSAASLPDPTRQAPVQERTPVVLHPMLVDVVGSIIAGISMLWAILAVRAWWTSLCLIPRRAEVSPAACMLTG